MSDDGLRPTFANAWDRLTYIVANAQLLVAGVLAFAGFLIAYTRPQIGVPGWLIDLLAGSLVLAPITFLAGLRIVRWLRQRRMIRVHHVNAADNVTKPYDVPPDVWNEKVVEGPPPYRTNDNEEYVVREYDYVEETGTLYVRGVWLSELQDTKLLTTRSHFQRVYEQLQDDHIQLSLFEDSLTDMMSELQTRLMNRIAEAKQRGEHLDKSAVRDVVADFEEDITSDRDDLADLQPDDVPEWDGPPEEAAVDAVESSSPALSESAAATDGGESDE